MNKFSRNKLIEDVLVEKKIIPVIRYMMQRNSKHLGISKQTPSEKQ